MPRIRIVFTGMMAAIAVTLAVSGARAQAATSEPSDAPPAALAGLMPPHESGTAHHAKTAHVKKAAAKKLAAKISKKSNTIAAVPSPQPRAAATDALPANPWPDAVPSVRCQPRRIDARGRRGRFDAGNTGARTQAERGNPG